jgi:hypothetical protein
MFFSGLDFPDHMAIYIWAHLEAQKDFVVAFVVQITQENNLHVQT